jgi:regulator of protease activity HflC (stomatin/prohibitin superfamily)
MESFVALLKNASPIFQWWVIIAPWEFALRVRLGKHVAKLGPGVHLRIPFVDAVYKQSVRLRVSVLPMKTTMSKDRKPLTIAGTLGYSIADIEKLYQTLHHAEDTLVNVARNVLSDIATATDSEQLRPELLAKVATDRISFERYGLKGVEVRVTDFAFVRTYRFISDSQWGMWGGKLDVDNKHS